MTDGLPNPTPGVQLPPLALSLTTGAARWLLTGLGAWLVKSGWISQGQQAQFIQIGLGVAIGLGALAWSAYEKQANHKTAQVAVAQAKAS